MRKFAFSSFIVFAFFANAQSELRDGYIVMNDDTVISGQLVDQSEEKNYISCLFTSASGEKTEYYPGNIIKGFGFDGDSYYSSEIKEGFFVEVLVKGYLSLHRFKDRFYLEKDTAIYLLESKTEEVEVKGRRILKDVSNWKGVTSYLVSDCQSNDNNLQNLRFEENSLVKIVSDYNECKEQDFTVFKEEKPFSVLRLGIVFGIVNSTIKTQSHPQPNGSTIDYMNDSYNSTDPMIGFSITAASPRTSENFTFHSGINFIQSKYAELYIHQEAQQIHYDESDILLTTINVPAYLNYTFLKREASFFFLAGGAIDTNIKSSTSIREEKVLASSVVITEPEMEAFSVDKTQIGTMVGLGVEKGFRQFSLSASMKYIRMSNLSESPGLVVKISRVVFGINISGL